MHCSLNTISPIYLIMILMMSHLDIGWIMRLDQMGILMKWDILTPIWIYHIHGILMVLALEQLSPVLWGLHF